MYERIPHSARAPLHRKVAFALERERADGVPVAATELATHFEKAREPMLALRYYAQAAEAALAKSAASECVSLTDRGLGLLPQAPEGAERDSLEIALATHRGTAATQVAGLGEETKRSFQHAYALLRDVPQHPMRRRVIHALGLTLSLCGDFAGALAVAEHAEALSTVENDAALMLAACVTRAHVYQHQARSQAARTWIERGLVTAERLDATSIEAFLVDPEVLLLGLHGIELVRLGLVEQAQARVQQAQARAAEVNQPMTRLTAVWFEALLEVRIGNVQRIATLAAQMRGLIDQFQLAQRPVCESFRGWAEARMGQPREGYERIRRTYEANQRLGMLAGSSEVLGYAAEALVLAGDPESAERELAEAFDIAEKIGERLYLPQLFLTEAAIARMRGESDAAEASVRRAVAEARAQEAPWFELKALVDLCEHQGAGVEDQCALAALANRLPEAVDTTPGQRARALLKKAKLA